MKCRKCGTEIHEGDYICRNCMTVVDAEMPSNLEREYDVPGKKKSSGLAIFVSVILAIVFFAVAIGTTVIYVARNMISTETISIALKDINISDIKVKTDDGETKNLALLIADTANKQVDEEHKFTEEKVREIIDDQDIKDYIADTIGDLDQYIMDDKQLDLRADDTLDLVQKKYEEVTGDKMTTEQIEVFRENFKQVEEVVNKGVADIRKEIIVSGGSDEVISINNIVKLVEKAVLYKLLGLLVIIAVLILLVNIRNIKAGFMTLFVPSFIIAVVLFLSKKGIAYLVEGIMEDGSMGVNNIVEIIQIGVNSATYIWGIACVVLMAGYILLNIIENARINRDINYT